MKNELIRMFEGNEVEVFEFEGNVLFNPYHVGKCLELEDVSVRRAMQSMNEKQKIKIEYSTVHNLNNLVIPTIPPSGRVFLTESGVYKLVFRSNKPNAEKFTDWVTDEVIPSIRKHGVYMTPETIEKVLYNPDFIMGIAKTLKSEQEKNKKLTIENQKLISLIEEQAPLVELSNNLIASDDTININQMAKILRDEKFKNVGRNRLFEFLRDEKILMNDNTPYQRYIEQDYFEVIESVGNDEKIYPQTLITTRGQVFVTRMVRNKYDNWLQERKRLEDLKQSQGEFSC